MVIIFNQILQYVMLLFQWSEYNSQFIYADGTLNDEAVFINKSTENLKIQVIWSAYYLGQTLSRLE